MNKEKKVYTYFVSYNYTNAGLGFGSGSIYICREKKIKNRLDLEGVKDHIKKDNGYQIIIMNFILLDE